MNFRSIVKWSPHHDNHFAVGAQDLRLYEVLSERKPGAQPSMFDNLNTTRRKRSYCLLSVNTDAPRLKCIEWCPDSREPLLVGCGMNSGQIVLTSFRGVSSGRDGGLSSENSSLLIPNKYSRSCNALAWNPVNTQQLAAGMDKVRGDSCALVWDITRCAAAAAASISGGKGGVSSSGSTASSATVPPGGGSAVGMSAGTSASSATASTAAAAPATHFSLGAPRGSGVVGGGVLKQQGGMGGKGPSAIASSTGGGSAIGSSSSGPATSSGRGRAVAELSHGEAAMALSWVPGQPYSLATGTGLKWLRLFDVRVGGRRAKAPLSVLAHPRAVYGVKFDPYRPHSLATFSDEGVVKVWDIRKLTSPPAATILCGTRSVAEIAWSTSQAGVLATVGEHHRWVSVWDVNRATPVPLGSTAAQAEAFLDAVSALDSTAGAGAASKASSVKSNTGSGGDIGALSSRLLSASNPHGTGAAAAATSSSNSNSNPVGGGTLQVRKPSLRRYASQPLLSLAWQPAATSLGCRSSRSRQEDATAEQAASGAQQGGVPTSAVYLSRYGEAFQPQQVQPLQQQLPPQQQVRTAAAAASNHTAHALPGSVGSELTPHRLLVATREGTVEDLSLHPSLPVALSSAAEMVFASGTLLFGGRVATPPPPPPPPLSPFPARSPQSLQSSLSAFQQLPFEVQLQQFKQQQQQMQMAQQLGGGTPLHATALHSLQPPPRSSQQSRALWHLSQATQPGRCWWLRLDVSDTMQERARRGYGMAHAANQRLIRSALAHARSLLSAYAAAAESGAGGGGGGSGGSSGSSDGSAAASAWQQQQPLAAVMAAEASLRSLCGLWEWVGHAQQLLATTPEQEEEANAAERSGAALPRPCHSLALAGVASLLCGGSAHSLSALQSVQQRQTHHHRSVSHAPVADAGRGGSAGGGGGGGGSAASAAARLLPSAPGSSLLGFATHSGDGRSAALRVCGWLPLPLPTPLAGGGGGGGDTRSAADGDAAGGGDDSSRSLLPLLLSQQQKQHLRDGSGSPTAATGAPLLSPWEAERLCALCVFHGDLRGAVDALSMAAAAAAAAAATGGAASSEPSADASLFQLAAMALAGYPVMQPPSAAATKPATSVSSQSRSRRGVALGGGGGGGGGTVAAALPNSDGGVAASAIASRVALWHDMCVSLIHSLRSKHPYLRAVFTFLSTPVSASATASASASASAASQGRASNRRSGRGSSRTVSSSPYRALLSPSSGLSLADRVAFACRFLPPHQLVPFVTAAETTTVAAGDLAGLLITGLSGRGVSLLQRHLDVTGDVQTVTLALSQLPQASLPPSARSRCSRWAQCYRDVLNAWKLWHVRARMDVRLAAVSNAAAAAAAAAAASSPAEGGAPSAAGEAAEERLRSSAAGGGGRGGVAAAAASSRRRSSHARSRTQLTVAAMASAATAAAAPPSTNATAAAAAASGTAVAVPPQLYVRCNYCNQALLLSALLRSSGGGGGSSSAWLSKQKPKMASCPGCKKALPRCALCLLPMASMNPHVETAHRVHTHNARGRRPHQPPHPSHLAPRSAAAHGAHGGGGGSAGGSSGGVSGGDSERLAGIGIPFQEWFSWCQSCRHGGHASHLSAWFTTHNECPVTACHCRCVEVDAAAAGEGGAALGVPPAPTAADAAPASPAAAATSAWHGQLGLQLQQQQHTQHLGQQQQQSHYHHQLQQPASLPQAVYFPSGGGMAARGGTPQQQQPQQQPQQQQAHRGRHHHSARGQRAAIHASSAAASAFLQQQQQQQLPGGQSQSALLGSVTSSPLPSPTTGVTGDSRPATSTTAMPFGFVWGP